MANEVTHVTVSLDNAMLQTLKMGLAALVGSAQMAEAHLNKSVNDALDAANPTAPEVPVPAKPNGHANGTEAPP